MASPVTVTNVTITPTLTAEDLDDVGLEGTYTDGLCNEFALSTLTNAQESTDVNDGSKAQKFTGTGAAQYADLFADTAVRWGWYDFSCWVKRASGTGNDFFVWPLLGNGDKVFFAPDSYWVATKRSAYSRVLSSTYVKRRYTFVDPSAVQWPGLRFYTAGTDAILVDTVSSKRMTLSTMMSAINYTASADVNVIGKWTQEQGCNAGVVARVDSWSSPANFIIACHNGDSTITLAKCVAGVYTELIKDSVTTCYCQDAEIEVRCTGTTVSLWYNGEKIGADQTVDHAAINSNTNHGLFSSAAENVCSTGTVMDYGATADTPHTWHLIAIDGVQKTVALMDAGDTLELHAGTTYRDYLATSMDWTAFPGGSSASVLTTLDGNGATIDMSTGSGTKEWLNFTGKSYWRMYDVNFIDYQKDYALYIAGGVQDIVVSGCTWRNADLASTPTIEDTIVITHASNVTFSDCHINGTISTTATCDGFEAEGGTYDVSFFGCSANNIANGASDENNGHGFEVYSNDSSHKTYNVSWTNCRAHNCRIGFSNEGGPDSLANRNVRAINCESYDNVYGDYQGKEGSSLLVQNPVESGRRSTYRGSVELTQARRGNRLRRGR